MGKYNFTLRGITREDLRDFRSRIKPDENEPVIIFHALWALSLFHHFASREGWEEEDIREVIREAVSGDYRYLCETLLKHTL